MSVQPAVLDSQWVGQRPRPRGFWVLISLLVLAGCATVRPPSESLEREAGSGGPAPMPLHLVQSRLMEVDDFEMGEEELPRPALLARVARFKGMAVLRPDGYLAWALSGTTQQRVGPVALEDGALRAGPFEVGAFYDGRGGAFFPVDERLERVWSHPPLAEVSLP